MLGCFRFDGNAYTLRERKILAESYIDLEA